MTKYRNKGVDPKWLQAEMCIRREAEPAAPASPCSSLIDCTIFAKSLPLRRGFRCIYAACYPRLLAEDAVTHTYNMAVRRGNIPPILPTAVLHHQDASPYSLASPPICPFLSSCSSSFIIAFHINSHHHTSG